MPTILLCIWPMNYWAAVHFFLRAFRKTMGLAPHQWLMVRRVERARELIQEGEQPLSEIALDAGFSDQSHFTRVFSQQMGVSPGAWRRAQSALPQ